DILNRANKKIHQGIISSLSVKPFNKHIAIDPNLPVNNNTKDSNQIRDECFINNERNYNKTLLSYQPSPFHSYNIKYGDFLQTEFVNSPSIDDIKYVDGNQLAHVLLNTNDLQYYDHFHHQLIAKSVIGSPHLNIDQIGLPTSIQFPREPISGLFLTPEIMEQMNREKSNKWDVLDCPWNLTACVSEITNYMLRTIIINNNLHLMKQYKTDESLHPDDETTFQSMSTTNKMNALKTFIGLIIGQVGQLYLTNESCISFAINNLHIESPDTILKHRKPRDLNNLLEQIPTNPIKYISSVSFPEGSFVRYDFQNRLQRTVEEEVLTINFTLPFGVTSGLLWFSESDQSKSYVYIKNSLLYYIYAITDQTGKAQRTVTEEIFLNSSLIPEKPQVLQLLRDKDNLTITLDHRSQASRSIAGRAPLVSSDGKVYLGGSIDPIKDTEGKVDRTFEGRITKAEITRKGDKDVNLLNVLVDPTWKDSIQPTGITDVRFRLPKAQLIIGPTSSNKRYSSLETEFSRVPVPITFMGTEDSIVRFDTWNFELYRSFKIEFSTYEPNGILFFVGPDQEHRDFVCVELFDGNVYFVYAVGGHYKHIRLNPPKTVVNDGGIYSVYVSRNAQHRFTVKFNNQLVDVEEGKEAHQAAFATYTYIGSIDNVGRLPWHVWSRENFAGCIHSILVNENSYLDVSSRMIQHTDIGRGIRLGQCEVPKQRCNEKICGGGRCSRRSYPFLEELNFACDCSESDKTFPEKTMDIRRSVGCDRDAPILEMDGDMVYVIDFEEQINKLITHTDDISLQFKTEVPIPGQSDHLPLFYSVSRADKSYFRVDLVNGQIRVQTNINHKGKPNAYEEFFLPSPSLNDNQWHTLHIARRADYIVISVDRASVTGKIPLLDPHDTFQLIAQQIYLGSAGPPNFDYVTAKPRFIGEFRNFYWNQYDLIGTKLFPTKYTTHLLNPPAIKHTFPIWPRQPNYAITCKSGLIYAHMNRPITMKNGGDTWLIEFKTTYDGVLFRARDIKDPSRIHITAMILGGRLHIIYSIHDQQGVYQIIGGPGAENIADGNWHRLALTLRKYNKEILAYLDGYSNEYLVGKNLRVDLMSQFDLFFGGLPEHEWSILLNLLRRYASSALSMSEVQNGQQPSLTGCIGSFSVRANNFTDNLLQLHDSYLTAYPASELIRGYCLDIQRCTSSYCRNGGTCRQISDKEVQCLCTGTGYEGPRCESPIRECPIGYCRNNARCQMINGQPVCDCSGTGYTGTMCEISPCSSGTYCQNNGRCYMIGSVATCDCKGTGFQGSRCEESICRPGYCRNNGICRVDLSGRPTCDCRTTGFYGEFCEKQSCSPGYCENGGYCRTDATGAPECHCKGTGFTGPRCRTPICNSGFCANNGRCYIGYNDEPQCNCTKTGYWGDRCQVPICTPDYCSNGGHCRISDDDKPYCDCRGTQYTGFLCKDPVCTPDYCGRGRCTVGPDNKPLCDCTGTGFTGQRCLDSICTPGYCGYGGVCTVDLRTQQPKCNCRGTGYSGTRCETPICPVNYCANHGECRVGPDDRPTCDCSRTNYGGPTCNIPLCPPNYCTGHGICVVRQRNPTCDCYPGFRGPRCEIEVCPPNYCMNGGTCYPGSDHRPHCTCPVNFEGDQCEMPKQCPPDYCLHGGRCEMNRGIPKCDCLGTDYKGTQCEIPETCPVGYCQNNGVCLVKSGSYVCDCTGTGYRGKTCTEPIACPPNYCYNGGVCSVLPGNVYKCDCSMTARTGPQCDNNAHGIHIGYEKDGYLIYNLIPSVRTIEDNVTFGFKTYMDSGTLVTFMMSDGRHWAIKLHDGRIIVDTGGKFSHDFGMRSNDGNYHIMNIERKGRTMIVTQDGEVLRLSLHDLVNPYDNSITYNAIHVAADEKKSDIFRGVIGGLHWNGRYPINDLQRGLVISTGTVTVVPTPSFPILPPKPQPQCIAGYCLNGGRCYAEDYQRKCDCRYTAYNGARCERQSRGFMPYTPDNGAYVVYHIQPLNRTNKDHLRVAFQTWHTNGPIVRVVQTDGSFYEVYLRNEKLYADINGAEFVISNPSQLFHDGRMHVITLDRDKSTFNFTVDGYQTSHIVPGIVSVDGSLISQEIILGADRNYQNTFKGVIGAFYWNGRYLINEIGSLDSNSKVMVAPGRNIAKSMDEIVVVLMPELLKPIGPIVNPDNKPLPEVLPEGTIAGGVVMPGLGTGNLELGGSIHISDGKGYGAGATGINAGSGLILSQAGGLFGLGGAMIDGLLAGLLLALLLLISALIWACWRCKPGCCGWCAGKSGSGLGGRNAWNRFAAICCAAPESAIIVKEKKHLLVSKMEYVLFGRCCCFSSSSSSSSYDNNNDDDYYYHHHHIMYLRLI
ncbi:Neurogenic locus notch-like protein, partial [Schistosoma japonicum]